MRSILLRLLVAGLAVGGAACTLKQINAVDLSQRLRLVVLMPLAESGGPCVQTNPFSEIVTVVVRVVPDGDESRAVERRFDAAAFAAATPAFPVVVFDTYVVIVVDGLDEAGQVVYRGRSAATVPPPQGAEPMDVLVWFAKTGETGGFSCTRGEMSKNRERHTATLMHDGSVAIIGGRPLSGTGSAVNEIEVYDPWTGEFTTRDDARFGSTDLPAVFDHTATLLNEYDAEGKLVTTESRIVIHGGCVAGDKDTCTSALKNIYLVTVDHRNKQWTLAKVSEMNHFTGRHMAVLLYAKPGPNVRQSQVFIAGGVGEGNLFSAELCDADLLSCTDEGFAASAGRQNGCMVQFVDPETGAARIFMGCGNKSYASAEVFGDGTFTTAGSLTSAREGCRCALAGSKVFIVGGICEAASQFAAQVETFDFATDQFQLLGSMGAGEYRVNHTVTATLDRYVLIAGGSLGPGTACGYDTPSDTAIVIDARGGPGGGPVIKSPPLEMRAGRQRHVATVLADGSILLTGGVQLAIGARGSAEIWVAPP